MRSSVASAVVCCCLLSSAVGRPQSTTPTTDVAAARHYFDQGLEHFRIGEFDAAVVDFEAAFRSKPHPSVLFNLGRAYAAAGRPVEATSALGRYLAEQATVITAERRMSVEKLIAAQKRRLGTIVVAAVPGVTIAVDGIVAGETPLPSGISVAPGNHALVATREGFLPAVLPVQLEAAETRELELKLEPLPATPPASTQVTSNPEPASGSTHTSTPPDPKHDIAEPAPATPHNSHILGHLGAISLAAGIASAALGEYFALSARDSWRDRNAHCGANGCDDQAVKDWQAAKHAAVGADVCFGMSLAAVGTGIYMLVAQPSDVPKSRAALLSVSHSNNSWLVQLGGHFE